MRPAEHDLRHGLVEALTGLIIALLVTFVVYASGQREAGANLSQRVLARTAVGGAVGTPTPAAATPRVWAFVDLGPHICRQGPGARCPPATLVSEDAAVASVVRQVRAAGPRVVILDVSSAGAGGAAGPATPELDAVLLEPGPPVLVAWGADATRRRWPSGARPEVLVTPADDKFLAQPRAHVRYLPALFTDGTGGDLAPILRLRGAGVDRTVPSLAYGAALVSLAPKDRAFSLVDGALGGAGKGAGIACLPERAAACLKAYERTDRIHSFRPNGPAELGTEEPAIWTAARFRYVYLPLKSSGAAAPTSLADAVVVIGDSREAAGDLHRSAAGEISGAEIVLSDTRQFALTPPAPEFTPLGLLWEEAPYYVAGFLVALLVHSLMARRSRLRASLTGRVRNALRQTSDAAISLVWLSVLTALAFLPLVALLPRTPGVPPDFVTPFVGLALEKVFEVGERLSSAARVLLSKRLLPPGPTQGTTP